jgi:hypothetical protein
MRCVLLLCMALMVCSGLCFAHPPASIKAAAVIDTATVTVTVEHHVADPATHYVKLVQIVADGKVVAEKTFQRQTDALTQTADLVVPGLKAGDKLLFRAYCSRFGSTESAITIE